MTLPLVPYRALHLVGCQSRWLCWEPVRWDYLGDYELEWIAAFEETCKEPAVEANPFHWSVKTGTSLTVRPPLGRKRLEGFVFQNIKQLWRNKKLWVIFLHLFCSSFSCPIGICHFCALVLQKAWKMCTEPPPSLVPAEELTSYWQNSLVLECTDRDRHSRQWTTNYASLLFQEFLPLFSHHVLKRAGRC